MTQSILFLLCFHRTLATIAGTPKYENIFFNNRKCTYSKSDFSKFPFSPDCNSLLYIVLDYVT